MVCHTRLVPVCQSWKNQHAYVCAEPNSKRICLHESEELNKCQCSEAAVQIILISYVLDDYLLVS